MSPSSLLLVSIVLLSLSLSCAPAVAMQGHIGPPGPAGSSPGNSPYCPDSYTRDLTLVNSVLCRQGTDEIVRVGRKGSAFWIDRYEASIWDKEDGTGKQYGSMMDDYPSSFPKNGQVISSKPLYALSVRSVIPSRFVTWFQANEACRASGKKLPSGSEWLSAARGTLDPGDSSGSGGACLTNANQPRNTGDGTKCVSDWGAEDMIGNLFEFTDEWHTGVASVFTTSNWPGSDYGNDLIANLSSKVYVDANATISSAPSALVRGGDFRGKTDSGIFALNFNAAPSVSGFPQGFRCVTTR